MKRMKEVRITVNKHSVLSFKANKKHLRITDEWPKLCWNSIEIPEEHLESLRDYIDLMLKSKDVK